MGEGVLGTTRACEGHVTVCKYVQEHRVCNCVQGRAKACKGVCRRVRVDKGV